MKRINKGVLILFLFSHVSCQLISQQVKVKPTSEQKTCFTEAIVEDLEHGIRQYALEKDLKEFNITPTMYSEGKCAGLYYLESEAKNSKLNWRIPFLLSEGIVLINSGTIDSSRINSLVYKNATNDEKGFFDEGPIEVPKNRINLKE